MLLTYDFYDLAEMSAVRALAGEAPIAGKLPIALPGMFEAGFGLMRVSPRRVRRAARAVIRGTGGSKLDPPYVRQPNQPF